MDPAESVQVAVGQYITDAIQKHQNRLLQSGTFSQSLTYVKVTTPAHCGTDSSINTSQTVNGVDTIASTLHKDVAYLVIQCNILIPQGINPIEMAKSITKRVPSAPNDASTIQKLTVAIQNAMQTLVIQENIMNQKIRYIVVNAACHVTITSDMLIEMIIGRLAEAISPIVGSSVVGTPQSTNTSLPWPAWTYLTPSDDWMLMTIVFIKTVLFCEEHTKKKSSGNV
jgi:hypothetical protein